MKCAINGCFAAGAYHPVIVVRPPKPLKGESTSVLEAVAFCDLCRVGMRVDQILTDEGWDLICRRLASRGKGPRPDRLLTTLRWVGMRFEPVPH